MALIIIIFVTGLGIIMVMSTAKPAPTDSAFIVQQAFQQDAARYEAMAAHYQVQQTFRQDAARYEAMAEYYLGKNQK